MARGPYTRDRFRRPEIIFQEFLRKGAEGSFVERDEYTPLIFRALVMAVDVNGGKLENQNGEGTVSHETEDGTVEVSARLGPENPPNSIKARIITDGFDKFVIDESAKVFWPFFPESISISIKPGEHVYVMFEDSNYQHGLWINKIPGHEGVNISPGDNHYKQNQSQPMAGKFEDTRAASNSTNENKSNSEKESEFKSGNKLQKKSGIKP